MRNRLGGTKIEAVVLESGRNPNVIVCKRIDTESEQGCHHILGRVKLLLDQVSEETGLVPEIVGFGTPGALDPITKTMKNCNTTFLNWQLMKSGLEVLLGCTT